MYDRLRAAKNSIMELREIARKAAIGDEDAAQRMFEMRMPWKGTELDGFIQGLNVALGEITHKQEDRS